MIQIYENRSDIWRPFLPKFGGLKHLISARFRKTSRLIANISGTQHDIVNRKTVLQTMDSSTQPNLIRCTLVHKRQKIGPELRPTQRAVIRLGTATHLVLVRVNASTCFSPSSKRTSRSRSSSCVLFFLSSISIQRLLPLLSIDIPGTWFQMKTSHPFYDINTEFNTTPSGLLTLIQNIPVPAYCAE